MKKGDIIPMSKIKVAMIGFGRTGKKIVRQIMKDNSLELVAVIRSRHGKNIGNTIGSVLHVKSDARIWPEDKLNEAIKKTKPKVFIDFSNHSATYSHIKIIAKNKINIVIGTTGFSDKELKKIKLYKKKIAIILAPNITEGVNILIESARRVAKVWPDCDINILETHFKKKKDAPSGTALKIAKLLNNDKKALAGEKTKALKKSKEIPIHSIRAGGIIGKHEVLFATQNQIVTIAHESLSRLAFAEGAIKAAKWIYLKKPGLYSMKRVLNL